MKNYTVYMTIVCIKKKERKSLFGLLAIQKVKILNLRKKND